MQIPECYDPVRQEECRQAAWDQAQSRWPVCDCCGHHISPGERFWTLTVRKDALTVCEDCRAEMEDSEALVEDLRYE